jgi:hypothetical protein
MVWAIVRPNVKMVFLDRSLFVGYGKGICMDEKNSAGKSRRTAWHPMLVFVMEQFAPADREILSEFSLNRLPQRVDIVVIEQKNVPAEPPRKLRSIFDHLRKHTLIEYKGVTDDLEPNDVYVLLAYAFQYMTLGNISDPDEMCLMFVAERIPASFVKRIQRFRGSFCPIGNGLWQGELAGLPLHGVELEDAYKSGPSERSLYLFTRAFLKDQRALVRKNELDAEEILMYQLLVEHVQQLCKDPQTMHLKDFDVAKLSLEEVYDIVLARTSVERRLKGLTPEERVSGMTPEALEQLAKELREKRS